MDYIRKITIVRTKIKKQIRCNINRLKYYNYRQSFFNCTNKKRQKSGESYYRFLPENSACCKSIH